MIPELELCERDYVVPKRRYSGFFHTDLDLLLHELGAVSYTHLDTSPPIMWGLAAREEKRG